MEIAVLLTCHNRKEKTKKCLQNLFKQELPEGAQLNIFLCDDGSIDGTSNMIALEFPSVHLVKGDGSLYWNGGMELAWQEAIKFGKHDFFIWLNDDTYLFPNAIKDIFEDYGKLDSKSLVTAACKIPNTNEFSYGGWDGFGPIKPNGIPQKVILISGNFVLIPEFIVNKIGTLSSYYTHYLGDYDYSLRAIEAGLNCYTSSKYLAECNTNLLPYWGNPNFSFRKRWKLLHDVKGQAFLEYLYFKFRHYGFVVGVKTFFDTYFKVLSPSLYTSFKNMFRRKILNKN